MNHSPIRSTFAAKRTWSSPPQRGEAKNLSDKPSSSADSVDLSMGRVPEEKSAMTLGKIGLLAMGALSIGLGAANLAASSSAPEVELGCAESACENDGPILHSDEEWGTSSFQLTRQQDGDVVVQFGHGDTVVNPAKNEIYESPGAAAQGTSQLGESLCEQAVDLGGHCVTDGLAFIPNGQHGILQVEQTGPETIVAGPIELSFGEEGVTVDRPGPDVLFRYEPGTDHFSKW
jgi:hypothetical protein